MIHHGDCIEVMAGMDADSVDAVVTDPPYGLEFMGKRWDAFKSPGRGARVAKERAAELTAPGKGHTSSKGPFLAAGVDQYIAGAPFQEWCFEWGREALRVTKPGGYLLAFGGTRTHHRLVCALEDAGWIIRDELTWVYASGFPKGRANLKPAHEPIVLARKPGKLRELAIDECRIPSSAEDQTAIANMGGFGKAGYQRKRTAGTFMQGTPEATEADPNPSGRWPSNLLLSDPELFDEPNPYVVGSGAKVHVNPPGQMTNGGGGLYEGGWGQHKPFGYDMDGGYSRFFRVPPGTNEQRAAESGSVSSPSDRDVDTPPADYPSHFIVPKADRADREPVLRGQLSSGTARENAHPTVKPTDLMRHLIRLVTPSGGTVLDPFLGSGSTAIACEMEGFAWIGIEKEAEYVAIAEARLNGVQRGLGLGA